MSDNEKTQMLMAADRLALRADSAYMEHVDVCMTPKEVHALADDMKRWADLIDRPTCHVVKFERAAFVTDGVAHRFFEFRCSNCGEESWLDSESVTKFCPNCGAEVV